MACPVSWYLVLFLGFAEKVEQARVTFEYEADNDDELTIRVGDVVDIINKDVDQDGWWEVRRRMFRRGWVVGGRG